MFKKQNIKAYALITGLAAILFLPITADADRAADRAMREDGRGLKSTRGNNSVAESLRQADGHPKGAPAGMPSEKMAPGTMHPGKMVPGTVADGSPEDCGGVPCATMAPANGAHGDVASGVTDGSPEDCGGVPC
tara:strand:+ start:1693 stop:2094 length:402 start_codon:yes stop_codon:yes gene_type:complete